MSAKNLLVELFVEELPPKALKKLGEAFAGVLFEQLKSQGLASADSKLTSFASPRRLAAHVTAVASNAADKAVSQKLMPVSVALAADESYVAVAETGARTVVRWWLTVPKAGALDLLVSDLPGDPDNIAFAAYHSSRNGN